MRVIHLDSVYHVGKRPMKQQRRTTKDVYESFGYTSMEGDAYSVSLDPGAWRKICHLPKTAAVWRLERTDGNPGVFADMTDEKMRSSVLRDALQVDLVRRATVYEFSAIDKHGDRVRFISDDPDEIEDARQYSVEDDERPSKIVTKVGYTGTSRLHKRYPGLFHRFPLTEDFAIIEMLKHDVELDGVWWPRDNPQRGGLFQHRMSRWQARKS